MDVVTGVTFIFYLVIFIASTFAEQCQKQSTCSCKTSKGTIDLHKLVDNKANPRFSFHWKYSIIYYWEPCYALSYSCGGAEDVAVCANDSLTLSSPVVGYQSYVSFLGDPSDDDLRIKYKGDSKSAIVFLTCNQDVEGEFHLLGVSSDYIHYKFELHSKYACLVSPSSLSIISPSSLSIGSVLLIVFFILLIVYLLVGSLYMKIARGAAGSEILPNKAFWTSLPGLIKDGMVFTFSCGKRDTDYSLVNMPNDCHI